MITVTVHLCKIATRNFNHPTVSRACTEVGTRNKKIYAKTVRSIAIALIPFDLHAVIIADVLYFAKSHILRSGGFRGDRDGTHDIPDM